MQSKRYTMEWEEIDGAKEAGVTLANRALEDPELKDLEEVVFGQFSVGYDDEEHITQIIRTLIENKDKLQHIKSFFFGDMSYEECEVSWITQGNYSELYEAFPNLEKLTIKGGKDLELGAVSHKNLKDIEIICGGLPKEVLHSLVKAYLPSLERLFVYLGVDEYGADWKIDDIKPLLNPELFPNLKSFCLVDSEAEDDIAIMVMESALPEKLEELAFCYGTLTDKGAQAILDNKGKLKNLKKLNLQHNYLSEEMVEKLKVLPFEVDAQDRQEPDEYHGEIYYNVYLSE